MTTTSSRDYNIRVYRKKIKKKEHVSQSLSLLAYRMDIPDLAEALRCTWTIKFDSAQPISRQSVLKIYLETKVFKQTETKIMLKR